MKNSIWLSSDPANEEGGEDHGFWWNKGCNAIAAASVDSTGIRFDGGDFTVIVDNPGQSGESVKIMVGDVIVYSTAKAKAKAS